MVLPVLLVVLGMAVWVLAAASTQLRCTDAAGVAARAAARGEQLATVQHLARATAPQDAEVEVEVRGGAETVEVRVRARVRPMGGALAALPALEVSGRAVAAREDAGGTP